LGVDLSNVAVRQFDREGDVCPIVTDLILNAPERFLNEHPDIKAKVFREGVMQTVFKKGTDPKDAEVIADAVLRGVGMKSESEPLEQEVFLRQPGNGEMIRVTPQAYTDATETDRTLGLLVAAKNLDKFWLQDPTDTAPRPFIEQQQKRRHR